MWIDLGSIPGLGISLEEGKGSPLPYSCLESSMESMGSQSQTLLCDSHFHFQFERTESLTSNWIFSEKKYIYLHFCCIYIQRELLGLKLCIC